MCFSCEFGSFNPKAKRVCVEKSAFSRCCVAQMNRHGRCLVDFCCVGFAVDKGSFCNNIRLEPVCDTTNTQHPNTCSLLFSQRKLAYKGFCKVSD